MHFSGGIANIETWQTSNQGELEFHLFTPKSGKLLLNLSENLGEI